MHGTYTPPKKGGGGKPIMSKKPVPKPPSTPKGTENGVKPGKAFPHK